MELSTYARRSGVSPYERQAFLGDATLLTSLSSQPYNPGAYSTLSDFDFLNVPGFCIQSKKEKSRDPSIPRQMGAPASLWQISRTAPTAFNKYSEWIEPTGRYEYRNDTQTFPEEITNTWIKKSSCAMICRSPTDVITKVLGAETTQEVIRALKFFGTTGFPANFTDGVIRTKMRKGATKVIVNNPDISIRYPEVFTADTTGWENITVEDKSLARIVEGVFILAMVKDAILAAKMSGTDDLYTLEAIGEKLIERRNQILAPLTQLETLRVNYYAIQDTNLISQYKFEADVSGSGIELADSRLFRLGLDHDAIEAITKLVDLFITYIGDPNVKKIAMRISDLSDPRRAYRPTPLSNDPFKNIFLVPTGEVSTQGTGGAVFKSNAQNLTSNWASISATKIVDTSFSPKAVQEADAIMNRMRLFTPPPPAKEEKSNLGLILALAAAGAVAYTQFKG